MEIDFKAIHDRNMSRVEGMTKTLAMSKLQKLDIWMAGKKDLSYDVMCLRDALKRRVTQSEAGLEILIN